MSFLAAFKHKLQDSIFRGRKLSSVHSLEGFCSHMERGKANIDLVGDLYLGNRVQAGAYDEFARNPGDFFAPI